MLRMFLPKPFLLFGISPLIRVGERLPTLEVNLEMWLSKDTQIHKVILNNYWIKGSGQLFRLQ